MMLAMTAGLTIERYAGLLAALDSDGAGALQRALDDIFFASSNTQAFASPQVRAEFRERWLGRYLTHDADWTYVALMRDRDVAGYEVAGYLAGCLDDPARSQRFADIGYFGSFAALTARYPAHLHINLAARNRGSGIGSALVSRFCNEAGRAGAPGVHVVTSRGARNVRFYERNGFHEAGVMGEGAKEVVFLAKALGKAGCDA